MERARRYKPQRSIFVLLAVVAVGVGALAARSAAQGPAGSPLIQRGEERPRKQVERIDRAALAARLRAAGYRKKGGIAKDKTDSHDGHFRSLPHFSSSFSSGGKTFPYTMLGQPPASGRGSRLRSVIVPLRMNFVFFEQDATFEPKMAVANIVRSPLFNDAKYPTDSGQFGDAFQRATFWNRMDPQRRWHTRMAPPRIARTVEIQVEPDIGELIQVGPAPTDVVGVMRLGAMDSQIRTIIQLADIAPDEVPIFVTQNVYADALGFHDAFALPCSDGSETLQTLIYTSWLDPALVGDIFGDVSTLSHEVGEWLDDPFVNNVVPFWAYPPNNEECANNPFLEVGDPQGNGPDFRAFPNFVVKLNDYDYHVQNLVMVPWFAHESPSTAVNGSYSFPDASQITSPATECQPATVAPALTTK
jgi:hypothetical protein